jgi:hypothetical protein
MSERSSKEPGSPPGAGWTEAVPYRPRRTFSLAEANGALSLVGRIARDVVDCHRRISELYGEARGHADAGRSEDADRLREEIGELFTDVESCVKELERIGCEYRDRAKGLVDFPSRLGDRLVFLCWKLGEPEILHWHELHDGFTGRRPIASYLSGEGGRSDS